MHQGSLFDEPDPADPVPIVGAYGQKTTGYVGAPFSNQTTSRDAARQIVHELNRLQKEVLAFVRNRGDLGATCEEVETGLVMRHTTASPRLKELREKGAVLDSGRTRPTSSGRKAIVWIVADQN